MSQITKSQLAEWEQRELAYYAEAEKWKQLEEKMKRQQEEQIAEWKRKDEALQRYQELNTYSEQEIRDAEYQIKMDRLKIILTHNEGSN
jgi:hypothetical protein